MKHPKRSHIWLLPFFYLSFCTNEVILRAVTARGFWQSGLAVACLFALVPALGLYFLCRLFPEKVNRVLELVVSWFFFLFYASQLIYFRIFGCFYSAYSMGNGGQVLEFWNVTIHTMGENWLPLVLLAIPPLCLTVFGRFFSSRRPKRWYRLMIVLVLAAAMHFGTVLLLPAFGREPLSAYDLYHNTNDLTSAVSRLGLLPAFRLDVHRLIFGFRGGALVPEQPVPTEPSTEPSSETELSTEPTEPPVDTSPNVLDIDFAGLMENETDPTIRQLHDYFSVQTPTAKNEKTGMFKGCNLILITAEGFSYLAVDPVLTPTLYKLTTQGFHFTNFYTPIWGVSTSDGEYVALTGTIPKNGVWSFSRTSNNAMPLTMVQQLKKLSYSAYAYHDHTYTFYDRNESHPNLGYIYKGLGNGLDVKATWPESDVEMIDLSTADYMGKEPFHAYYMTVSGHLEYNFYGNMMAAKNRELVEDLPYSDAAKAYLACNIELDRALALLLERLEEAGVADNTVIALSADHYPYGLTVDEQSELAGHEIDERFEMYRNACIIYKKGMTPETVDRPCSSLDLLPTLSNLFGLDFDSRLYMGQDVFSDADPLIIFSDHSWLTERGSYYMPTGEYTPFDGTELTDEEITRINGVVSNKFTASAWVLESDYWRTLFGDNLPPDDAEN